MAEKKCKACGASLEGARVRGQKNGFTFLQCALCEAVTVDPFPTEAELTAFYQAYEGTTDYRRKQDKKIKRASKRLQKLMALTQGRDFLDVGCNYGFTVEAAKRLGLKAVGIDIDEMAVKASNESFGPSYQTISVVDYAVKGLQFDIAYSSEVIEHVPDPSAFVAALAKLVKPNGVLMLTTPDGGHWRVPQDFAKWEAAIPPEHITYFSKKGMRILLEKHGFQILKMPWRLKPGLQVIARKTA
jgi:SAM-dependent methyltransferase